MNVSDTTKKVFLWIILAFFVVALADFYPRIAMWLMFLLITSVLLTNYTKYGTLFNLVNTKLLGN